MNQANTNRANTAGQGPGWALLKGRGFWELIFEGQSAIFKHEQGAYYAAYLLLHPPAEPLHGLALALRTEAMFQPPKVAAELQAFPGGQRVAPDAGALVLERSLGLEEAWAAWALRRKQRQLEAQLEDEAESPQAKAEAARELAEVYEFQKRHPWRAGDAAQRAATAVAKALKRFHQHLAAATDSQGHAHPVLRAFAAHLLEHVLIPSGRGQVRGGPRLRAAHPGCFIYQPPAGVVWRGTRSPQAGPS